MRKDTTKYNQELLETSASKENLILLIFIVISLLISLFPVHYGYFRDELYYIALSKNLAWGYVDVPPLMPICIAAMRWLFGSSLTAIHLLPAAFGVIVLILTRSIVKKFDGGLFAQTLALTSVTFALFYDVVNSWVTYDSFNRLFWSLGIYSIVCLLKTEKKKYWIYAGIFAGLGLMCKFDMFWLGGGILIALLFTRQRKYYLCRQFWIGGLIAFIILLPYLIWIIDTNFLTLEYFRNYSHETAHINFLMFFVAQIFVMNYLALPVWFCGLYYFIFNKTGKKYRLLGIAYFAIAVLCVAMQTKFYVIMPFYFVLFAGGAVLIESLIGKSRMLWLKIVYCSLIIIVGLIYLPLMRPVLPVQAAAEYANFLMPSSKRIATENFKPTILPQILADRFGWKEMTAKVAKIYYSLPEEQRKNTYIFTSNYGEASAIYFYRKEYRLPIPISEHLQYYVWGYRGANQKSTFIRVGKSKESMEHYRTFFDSVKKVGQIDSEYGMSSENKPIYLCTGLKIPIEKLWLAGKSMNM